MGVDLSAWRARVGSFPNQGRRRKGQERGRQKVPVLDIFAFGGVPDHGIGIGRQKGGGELDQFLRLDVKREKRNGDGELELIINFLPLYATIFSMFVLFALLKLPTATMVAFLGLLYICVGRITQTVIYPLEVMKLKTLFALWKTWKKMEIFDCSKKIYKAGRMKVFSLRFACLSICLYLFTCRQLIANDIEENPGPRTIFEILGLEKDSSPEAIEKAYRDMAKVLHPDRLFHAEPAQRKRAEQEMQELTAAFRCWRKELTKLSHEAHRSSEEELPQTTAPENMNATMLGMTKEEAAIICQRRYRDRLRKRKEEEERRWLRLIGSLVPFQANARGFLARRCHHEKELEKKDIMNQAATLMQAITRGFLERRRHAKRVKEEEEAEAKRRAEEEALFLRMKSAAKKMQRWWRKISMRMLSASLKIQRWWRSGQIEKKRMEHQQMRKEERERKKKLEEEEERSRREHLARRKEKNRLVRRPPFFGGGALRFRAASSASLPSTSTPGCGKQVSQ